MKKLIVCLLFLSCENKIEDIKNPQPYPTNVVKDNDKPVAKSSYSNNKKKSNKGYYRYRRNRR